MIPTNQGGAPRPDAAAVAPEGLEWPAALAVPGAEQEAALRLLHALMLKAARHQVWRMRGMLEGRGPDFYEDLAHSAADDALAALMAKLSTFEGRSRFTTWAYKFAVLQAATEVRRQAWANREVGLDDLDVASDPSSSPGPEEHAEAADLARAVENAMHVALTPYQRRIAVALLLDHVPIDVLADRLGTTRGALYKALHEARARLRGSLVASGHLPAATAPGGRR